jgi:hypothetical protein
MNKNQNGFTLVEIILVIIFMALIGFTGWYVLNPTGNRSGNFISKHFSLSIETSQPNYQLVTYFDDSIEPSSKCQSLQDGFVGSIIEKSIKDDGARLAITQNKKPYAPKKQATEDSVGPGYCGDSAEGTYKASYTLKNDWLENGPSKKQLIIQNKEYDLNLDKKSFILTLSHGSQSSSAVKIPNEIGSIDFTYTYPNCISRDELKAFAGNHGIQLAESKYPGLDDSLWHFQLSKTHGDPHVRNYILVIKNNNFDKLRGQLSGSPNIGN